MIRILSLSKSFRLRDRRQVVIDDLTLDIPSGKSVALLGRNGAGKSTLLKMIAGTVRPDAGRIETRGSVSWPVGFGTSFHGDLTGAQNARFLARIYGVDTDELIAFVEDFAELGDHFHMPIRNYSTGMRARLMFGLTLGIRFDTYLVDEVTAVGDAAFRRKSSAVFRERIGCSGAIVVSHNMSELRALCDSGLVLQDGHARYFDDLEDAIDVHTTAMAQA